VKPRNTGKALFSALGKMKLQSSKKHYPDALYLGITDGAKNN
jgi:hypothetical protein